MNENNNDKLQDTEAEIKKEPLDSVPSSQSSSNKYYYNADNTSSNVQDIISDSGDNERKPSDLNSAKLNIQNPAQKILFDVEMKSDEENTAVTNSSGMVSSNSGESNPSKPIQQNNPDRRDTHKRKKSAPQKLVVKKPRENVTYEDNNDSGSETEEYCIILTNVAKDVHISDYVKECGVSENRLQLTYEEGNVQLAFQSVQDYQKVQKRLSEDRIKGKTLRFKLSGQEADTTNYLPSSTEIINQSTWSPDVDNRETKYIDPLGLYGLKIEFLRSLDITPPIDRWVHVTNFRCDKFELRDVMELAGRVLSCSVMNVNKRFAKVQYSHPLEAVQAISMLNGQMYFGMKLKLFLEPNPRNDIILPKGLANIGLGLGLYGRPIRDIAQQYKNFRRQKHSTISPILFQSNFDNCNSKDEGENETESIETPNKRSFEVKHAEDLDSIDGVQSEKDFAKNSYSPESNSIKSIDSPASSQDVRDFERSNDFSRPQHLSTSDSGAQSEVPGNLMPVTNKQTSPGNLQRPDQKLRPQTLDSTSFTPGPPDPQVQALNQYLPSYRSGSVNVMQLRPNPIYQTMPNPIGIPPRSGPFGLSQVPTSIHSQVHGPGLVHGPGPIRGPGPVHGPSPVRGPGPVHGPGSMLGPRPVHCPGPVHGPGPIQGPGQVRGPGPIQGPGPVHGPIQGPVHRPGLGQGPSSVSGPSPVLGPGPGAVLPPGYVPGPNLAPGSGPKRPQEQKMTVEFANLPPSTTFPFLCEKLSQCGQVTSLRFTTPGCAVVTFAHPSHAERCYQTYNGMVVEGYRIAVTTL